MESDADLSPETPTHYPPGYPSAFDRRVELAGGERIHVRPVVPEDIDRLRHAFEEGDRESIRMRFFTGAPPAKESNLHYLVEIDYRYRFAIVAMDDEGNSIGIARYEGQETSDAAEIAVVVAPEWRRRGIARTFLETLEARAREVGIERFEAVYLSENKHIASLLKGLEYSDRALREGLVYMSKTL